MLFNDSPLFCIIVAAGSGERLGMRVPKALVEISGIPILQRAVHALRKAAPHLFFVIAAPPGHEQTFEALVPDALVVSGGAMRSDSVRQGLKALWHRYAPQADALVVVHDAARCLVHPSDVARVIHAATQSGAATLAAKVTDTIVRCGTDGRVRDYIDREALCSVQTPQVFRWSILERAHRDSAIATDDSSLVASFHPVAIVESEHLNIKVTTPSDLVYAGLLCDVESIKSEAQ